MTVFFNRKEELQSLGDILNQSYTSSCFTIITGRRRVGKTELLKQFLTAQCKKEQSAYLFTFRSSESILCKQWQKDLEDQISLKIFGRVESLRDLFEQVFIFAQTQNITLVIDEFQDLDNINKAFFSQLQNVWDSYKASAKINLIVSGSVFSMMTHIFMHNREPLFGRSTHQIHLQPFTPSAIKEILGTFYPQFDQEDLLCLYMLSGGVAKYIFLLMEAKAFTKHKMIDYAISSTSPFLTDGKELLASEIGKDYGIYFSILSLISSGLTSQSEIDSIILKNTGNYLHNLEKAFSAIKPVRPLFSKPGSRNLRYFISDPYLRFYFKFIWANQSIIELGQYNALKEIIFGEYQSFTGKTLETYFLAKIAEEEKITELGSWWDKKSQNEIDIIALNAIEKTAIIYEVKRQKNKIHLSQLKEKAIFLNENLKDYSIRFEALSMSEM
ncbi:ATP-binding protein [Spirochaetota bacterium]